MERAGSGVAVVESGDFPTETVGDVVLVLIPYNSLDIANAEEFQQRLDRMLAQHSRAILDLQQVDFIDSMGCSTILTCLRQATLAGGDLKVCGLTQAVRAVFEMIRIHRVLETYPTRAEALAAFDS